MPSGQLRLLLTFNSELVDGVPLLVSCNGLPVQWARKEPAGHSFHEAALRRLGFERSHEDPSGREEKEKSESPSVESFNYKGKRKHNTGGDQQDHYALLGLSHLRFLASEEQIRKSYRDVALKHHPDKQAALLSLEKSEKAREAKREEIDRHFKAIQEAYEILTDPTKRRLYDSVDEFDDEVPSDCAPDDFFKVFGPVFLRNARWSHTHPVPALGEDSTPIAEVDSFYNFWWRFKSWREFPHADEFDLEQAESREHKRWMERQNAKLREKARKEEVERIRTLIDNAYKRDPRIVRRKEEEKAEKLRRTQAKILAREEKEKEAARMAEEERLRKVEEDRNAALEVAAQKKIREKEKKLLRKERQRLRAAAAAVVSQKFGVSDDAVEFLCTSLDITSMSKLCDGLENSKDLEERADNLRSFLKGSEHEIFPSEQPNSSAKRLDEAAGTASGPKSNASEDQSTSLTGKPDKSSKATAERSQEHVGTSNGSEKKEKPWTKEEVELLRKAVAKYPKGTSQRWEVVSNHVGTGRTVDEILRAIKTVLLKKPDSSEVYGSFLSKRKPTADISSPLTTRDDADETALRSAAAAGLDVYPNGNAGGSGLDRKGKVVNGVSHSAGLSVGDKGSSRSSTQNGIASGAPGGNANVVEQDVWSDVQELALVKALKTLPKDAQRWDRIAAAVPGKTKLQCQKKYKELRESFRSQRD